MEYHKQFVVIKRMLPYQLQEANDQKILKGIIPESHFKLAYEKLGIEVIVVNSSKSKGREIRNHKVYQDRFVKELRLANYR